MSSISTTSVYNTSKDLLKADTTLTKAIGTGDQQGITKALSSDLDAFEKANGGSSQGFMNHLNDLNTSNNGYNDSNWEAFMDSAKSSYGSTEKSEPTYGFEIPREQGASDQEMMITSSTTSSGGTGNTEPTYGFEIPREQSAGDQDMMITSSTTSGGSTTSTTSSSSTTTGASAVSKATTNLENAIANKSNATTGNKS